MTNATIIMNAEEIKKALDKLADEILNAVKEPEKLALIGIRTRGVHIAMRLKAILDEKLKHKNGQELPFGKLDINLYRDDFHQKRNQPVIGITDIPFDVTDKIILLCDDVMFTGRTTRAALDAIIDFGRPKSVKAVALIDRGLREYPIQPDFVSKKVETSDKETVKVRLVETDGEDKVILTDDQD